MNRRDSVLALLALAAAPLAVNAQQLGKIPVIGFLHPGFPSGKVVNISEVGLREGLRELGHVEGQTIKIEWRWGLGKPSALAGLAAELVRLKVDVVMAVGPPSVFAAKQATTTLPIIAIDLETDPIAAGLIASFAKPGGNITGLFLDLPGLTNKWLQLIRDIRPDTKRLAILWHAPTGPYQLRPIVAAAKSVSIETQVLEFRDGSELAAALNSSLKGRPQALIQLGSPLINNSGKQIADFSAANRLPSISAFRSFPDNGGLMSYGPNLSILYRRMGHYIAKIIKGEKPGDLPVELPTHFELILNAKAAKEMGLTVPQSLLLRSDEVIQ